jgi:hypothetical protein
LLSTEINILVEKHYSYGYCNYIKKSHTAG